MTGTRCSPGRQRSPCGRQRSPCVAAERGAAVLKRRTLQPQHTSQESRYESWVPSSVTSSIDLINYITMKYMLACLAVVALCGAAHASLGYWAGPPAHIQLTHDGKYVADTPEVAHAKAAHLAAHAAAAHGAHGAHYGGPAHGAHYEHYGAPGAGLHKYGPAPLAHDGRVIDTPEVAHLKHAHLAAHAAAHHGVLGHAGLGELAHGYGQEGYAHGHGKWHGPQAHIQLTHDGKFVVDTPEVAHARAAHLAAVAHAAHVAAASPDPYEHAWDGPAHGPWH